MFQILAIGIPGVGELLLVLAVAALIVYRKRLPDVAHHVGRCIAEFKRGLKSLEDELLT
jgi:TatA/E family protein of Tat protein translocase